MTTNNANMGISRECIQLNPGKKMKIKVNADGNILYVNNYFTELTKLSISEVILKDLSVIFDYDMPKIAGKLIFENIQKNSVYLIIKGRIKDNTCYWGFVKSTIEYNEYNEVKAYVLEVKMLPTKAISKMDKLYDILKEIENNAGVSAAEKYLKGYIEDKGLTIENFILNVTEVNEKDAEKYFEIDEDAPVKKKKRSWF
jgi:hypothetical protein